MQNKSFRSSSTSISTLQIKHPSHEEIINRLHTNIHLQVGRDFLPRGCNIVTRRPLILQLIKTAPTPGQYSEWGEFLHLPGKRYFDFDRIRQEIIAETERLLGPTKGISDQPIRLRIYSPNVLTMTLVDLPGLARVPVGDQPQDIESRLRKLILDYISAPSCIILAVSPANQDIASSDALDLARQADPEGVRTIGVLTKLDIMDRGTDAAAVLRNEVVPLRLGYVGVVLRSQEDIAERKSMAEARNAERAFFQSRPEYSSVLGSCSISILARTINGILVDTIRDMLPMLRSKLEEAIASRRRELRLYGDAAPGSTDAARGALLLSVLDSYSSRFSSMLDGQGEHLPITELAGGARIRHIFQQIFTAGLNELDPTAELTDEDVRTAIKNSGGIKGSLLIPEAPFELLVRRAIDRLLAPSLQCKEFVHAELLRIAAECVPPEVGRFPVLQTVLAEAVEEFINDGASPAEHMIRNLVACELSFINTSHPQFIGGNRAIAQVLERHSIHGADLSRDDHDMDGRILPRAGPRAPRAHPVVTSSLEPHGLAAAAKLNTVPRRTGMEPEVFHPSELLFNARRREAACVTPVPPGAAPHDGDGDGDAPSKGWFSNWFAHRGGGDDPAGINLGSSSDQANEVSPTASVLKRPPPTLRVPEAVSDQEEVQVEVTRVLVDSYFDIVRKNLQDSVPKALMHFLVNHVRRGLQQHLIRRLYKEELFGDIMSEREDVASKRQQCQEALRALRHAQKALEVLPSELAGRASSSGARWNFRQVLSAPNSVDGDEIVDDRTAMSAHHRRRQTKHVSSDGTASNGHQESIGEGKRPHSSPLRSGLKANAAAVSKQQKASMLMLSGNENVKRV